MNNQNEDTLKSLIMPYQQKIFALVLYLVGQDRDMAYNVCASSFAEAIQESPPMEQKDIFLSRLITISVEKCRKVKTIPTLDVNELLKCADAEKGSLHIIVKALQMLDFELKVPLFLRFQLNLSYGAIGKVMQASDSDARSKTTHARAQLEKEIKHILSDG